MLDRTASVQHVALVAPSFKMRPKSRNEKRIVSRLRQRKGQLWHHHTSRQHRCPILHLRGKPEEAIELRKANQSYFLVYYTALWAFRFFLLFCFILLRISHLTRRGECSRRPFPCTTTCFFLLMRYPVIYCFYCLAFQPGVEGLPCVLFQGLMYRV